jgi:4-nitrophenyl phosphatase
MTSTNIPQLQPSPNWTPPSRSDLTSEQESFLNELKEKIIPCLTTNLEKEFCDEACLKRYLRATKWQVNDAFQRLKNTLKWRQEFQPELITPAQVQKEAESGKQFLNGFDKQGRPILYLVPKRENTKASDTQLKFVVYNLEKAIQLMPPGVDSLVIILDYDNMSILNAPSPNTGRKFLTILGNHYPERLGQAFVFNPTWYLYTFFKVFFSTFSTFC